MGLSNDINTVLATTFFLAAMQIFGPYNKKAIPAHWNLFMNELREMLLNFP